MRDKMLNDVKVKQQNDLLDRQNEERARVLKLNMELEKEKDQKAQKKVLQREAAMKVITDNNNEKKKRMAANEIQRQKEAQEVEKYIKKQLDDEAKRDQAIKERGEKIQKVMDSMAEVVNNRDKEMERKQERDYIAQSIEKDEQAHVLDLNKKLKARQNAQKMNQVLTQQMKEKQQARDNDIRANQSFMNRWVEQMNESDKKRVAVEQQRKNKIIDNQSFLKSQIDGQTVIPGKGSAHGDIAVQKKYKMGGLMDPEEAKMNRELLKDIAAVKRGEEPSRRLKQAVGQPI